MGWHFSSNHFCVIPKYRQGISYFWQYSPLEYSRAQVTSSESSDSWLPFFPVHSGQSSTLSLLVSPTGWRYSAFMKCILDTQHSWNTYWEILTSYQVWPLCSFSIFIKGKELGENSHSLVSYLHILYFKEKKAISFMFVFQKPNNTFLKTKNSLWEARRF